MGKGSALLHSVEKSCWDHKVSHAMDDQSPGVNQTGRETNHLSVLKCLHAGL